MGDARQGALLEMTNGRGGPDEAGRHIEFLRQLQRLLDEGQFVASYKFALLMALSEIAVERSPASDGSLSIPMRDIAERIIELYWPQVAPFREAAVLEQNTGRTAVMIRDIQQARESHGTLARARHSPAWGRLVTRIRAHVIKMPLWRLQVMGGAVTPFLYERRLDYGDSLVLQPGVASSFRTLSTLVGALLQAAWIRYLHRVPANRPIIGPQGDLAEFLFGSERNALGSLREPLRELQSGTCLYCRRRLATAGDVDHFIPWSKYPRDLGHNFVLAHASCNQAKSDLLADVPHLESWLRRNADNRKELAEIFRTQGVLEDERTSLGVATWAYENAERGKAMVWRSGGDYVSLNAEWRRSVKTAERELATIFTKTA